MPRRRQINRRVEKPIVLILSEDTGGVCRFLQQSLNFGRNSKVSFVIKGVGKGPKSLFQIAQKAVKGAQRGMPPAAAVFLVFDRDTDTNFEPTLLAAHPLRNIFCFTTSPCIEYFFLLHFQETSRPFSSYNEVFAELSKLPGFERYHKGDGGVPVGLLHANRDSGISNSEIVRVGRRSDSRKIPHSDIDVLFQVCEELAANGIDVIKGFDFSRLLCHDQF